jgi:hypothetical protein
MFAFSKSSSDDTQGYEDPRMQEYAPDESDASQLVWNIPPSKRYFKPSDSYMTFTCDLPDTVVPDNGFVDKLFDGMNIEVQQDLVTSKNTDSESAISGHFWRKSMFDQNYLDSTMSLVGCYDIHNIDSHDLKRSPQIIAGRRLNATKIFKKIEIREVTYNTVWYRYEFISPLNHGFAREPCCFPDNLEICLKLYRAPSSAAVMKISDEITCHDGTKIPYEFDDSYIELRRPRLCAMFLRSEKLDAKMAKYRSYDYECNFYDYPIRLNILDSGESEFLVNLSRGAFPKYAFFAIRPMNEESPTMERCLTNFNRHDLESFTVLVNSEPLPGHPLTTDTKFYYNFLQNTDRLFNPWSSGVLPFHHYAHHNFFVVINFDNLKRDSGPLHVKLRFRKNLEEKFHLIFMPVYAKKFVKTPHNDISVTDQ